MLGDAGHLLRGREAEFLPEDEEPLDDFEPELDDPDEPPERDPVADFLADDPPERPFDVLLELLLDEPLFEVEDRVPPLFVEEEPRFVDEPLFVEPVRDEVPDDFVELPDDELFFEPVDEALLPVVLPLDDFLPDDPDEPDFDEPLLEDEPDRAPLFDEEAERPLPPPELFRDEDEELPLFVPPRDRPLDAPVCVPAIAD